ncbi:hypothetical protein DPMN_065964 [Dreissena polymorpha]|uniref:Uncharacterized protein n=1 Tax=Dreissena polymorpha TaxID=45954 RepID=A0A9D4BK28_DREPO|nr:hypothetical protein DPMN_065964 [Dreissena polymorpha]
MGLMTHVASVTPDQTAHNAHSVQEVPCQLYWHKKFRGLIRIFRVLIRPLIIIVTTL